MEPNFPVHLLIDTPQGDLPLTPERSRLPLPQGPEPDRPPLTYGPYLEALASYLTQDACTPLRLALASQLGKPVPLDEIRRVEVISRKHGALYHVAQVRVQLAERITSLALNVAVHPDQQEVLDSEYHLLEDLHRRFGRPFLPRPYLLGETQVEGLEASSWHLEHKTRQNASREIGGPGSFKLLLAEWFDGYDEFHLSVPEKEKNSVITVWRDRGERHILSADQAHSLYVGAASLLTTYLDEHSFEQIYPWHHGAGDFILALRDEAVDVRMVTARDYRRLLALGSEPEDKWIAIVHFFLNLTLRMRLDRLDGTGDLVWAEPGCLRGVSAGFFRAWNEKAQKSPSLPSVEAVLDLFRHFSIEEWLPLAEVILEDGLVEADEHRFIHVRLEEHIHALHASLEDDSVLDAVLSKPLIP